MILAASSVAFWCKRPFAQRTASAGAPIINPIAKPTSSSDSTDVFKGTAIGRRIMSAPTPAAMSPPTPAMPPVLANSLRLSVSLPLSPSLNFAIALATSAGRNKPVVDHAWVAIGEGPVSLSAR